MFLKNKKWWYLIGLSLLWGSSFIVMKKALVGISPIQLGALRILITGIFLLAIGFRSLQKIEKEQWKYIAYTAFLGTFFPAFMFAFAVDAIDSSIVAILNSLTPFNTLLFGAVVFGIPFLKKQLIGILIGLLGTLLLILKGADLHPDQNYGVAILIFIASIGYALNVNMIKKHLKNVSALSITTGNFVVMIPPALFVLFLSGFFTSFEMTETTVSSLGYILILAVFGTGIAKILFNKLVHMTTPIFASSVTYLIPVVAVLWGILDGEKLSGIQIAAGAIIMIGVYLVNKVR